MSNDSSQTITFNSKTWKDKEKVVSAIVTVYLNPIHDVERGGN
jgi:hypothetical protein